MKKSNVSNNQHIFKLICLFIGIILTIIDILLISNTIINTKNAVEIEANISSLEYQGETSIITISYDVNEKHYENTIKTKKTLAVGDTISLKYDKNNPNKILNNNINIAIFILIPFIIIFTKIGLPYTIKYLQKIKKTKYLKTKGIYITADILEIYIDNSSPAIKNKKPYIIRLKYINPQDNNQYIFESDPSYENISELINTKQITKLPVYIDSTNTTSYYVDITSITN